MKTLTCLILILNLASCSLPGHKKEEIKTEGPKVLKIDHQKLCLKGSASDCYKVGEDYKKWDNLELSLAYFLKGCRLEDLNSCVGSGVIYENFRNFIAAKKKYNKACKKDNGLGCYHLGIHYSRFKNFKRGKQFLKLSCDLKNPQGCKGLGLFYLRFNKFVLGNKYLSLSCKIEEKKDCNFDQETADVYLKVNEELSGFKLLCNEGSEGAAKSCIRVATVQKKWGKIEEAFIFYEKACHLGDQNSCLEAKQAQLTFKQKPQPEGMLKVSKKE